MRKLLILGLLIASYAVAQTRTGGGQQPASSSGTVNANSGTVGAFAFYPAAGGSTTVGPDLALSDNLTTITSTEQLNLPAGTCTNPSLVMNGTLTFGFEQVSTTKWALCSNNANEMDFSTTNIEQGDLNAYAISQTVSGNGTIGLNLAAAGTGATEAWDMTGGASTQLLLSGNPSKPTFPITLSTSAVTIFTWTLPNVAKTWTWQCSLTYNVTAGTSPTVSIGVNPSQTPTATTKGYAAIYLTAASITGSTGGASISASGSTNLLTSGTVTTTSTDLMATTFGTLAASATSGTFSITVTGTGASFAGTVQTGACSLV